MQFRRRLRRNIDIDTDMIVIHRACAQLSFVLSGACTVFQLENRFASNNSVDPDNAFGVINWHLLHRGPFGMDSGIRCNSEMDQIPRDFLSEHEVTFP
jgi:hypothetical protein